MPVERPPRGSAFVGRKCVAPFGGLDSRERPRPTRSRGWQADCRPFLGLNEPRRVPFESVCPASDASWLKTCPCRAMGMAPGAPKEARLLLLEVCRPLRGLRFAREATPH